MIEEGVEKNKEGREISLANFQMIHVDSPPSSRCGLISLIFLICLHLGKILISIRCSLILS